MNELEMTVFRPSAASGAALLEGAHPPPGGPTPPTSFVVRRIRRCQLTSHPGSRRWAGTPTSTKVQNPRLSLEGIPARVIADYGVECLVNDGADSSAPLVARSLRNDGATMPAVGDWVSVLKRETVGAIQGVVERRNRFHPQSRGDRDPEQSSPANVDVAFVVPRPLTSMPAASSAI